MTIRKAVIPAAGFGTRFLPATKSQPKEMLPIVDTPVIQYVVEEAVAAGITDILMIIGKGKRAIEEHFDRSFQLEAQLLEKGRKEELEKVRRISELADIHFVWQKEMKGLGDAIYCARHHVNDEPFAVLLGDTVIESKVPAIQQLMDVYRRYQDPVVLLEEVDRQRVSRYGVIDGREIRSGLYLVNDFVEKPAVDKAPSNLVIASRYIFTPGIFGYLEQTRPGKGGEIQITDAMRRMVRDRAMYGKKLKGRRCDIGNKEGFVRTNMEFALQRPDMAREMKKFIRDLAKKL
ncbi:MAG: UTP--glucose-1-phosphate uridylyltransferase GalU [Sedimentisphaerales bacterium]|nr:UTP--glucose-1-phosphate uridylyltransferase GalU [Sedimentisphaerales bacterium]